MPFIRSALFAVIYTVLTVAYGTFSLVLLPLKVRTRHRIMASWTAVVIWLLRWVCGVRYEVVGLEHKPAADQPVVILSKHQSTWETLYLQSLFWPASTVLKRELLKIPFFGWGLRALVPIAIDRANPRDALKQVKTKGLNRISHGYNILLFPEGTRMKPGERGKYARSGADIAVAAQVDVLPIALNAGRCWPSKSFVKYPGKITVVIGPPISVDGKSSKQIIGEVEDWIENQMTTL